MTLRLLGLASILLLVVPGCDSSSSSILSDVSSSNRADLEQSISDEFDCDATVRSITGRASGRLAPGDCLRPDDSYQDYYAFRLSEAASIDVDLRSADFVPYLFLFRADLGSADPLTEIARDPNSDQTDRARVSVSLQPGLYVIFANSDSGGEVGDYTLSVDAATYRSQGRPAVQAHTASGRK